MIFCFQWASLEGSIPANSTADPAEASGGLALIFAGLEGQPDWGGGRRCRRCFWRDYGTDVWGETELSFLVWCQDPRNKCTRKSMRREVTCIYACTFIFMKGLDTLAQPRLHLLKQLPTKKSKIKINIKKLPTSTILLFTCKYSKTIIECSSGSAY